MKARAVMWLAVAVLAVGGRAATAEDGSPRPVPFTPVAKRADGGGPRARQLVIEDDAAYRELFAGKPPVAVDFTRERVLAVCSGKTRTTGFSIEILSLTEIGSGATAGLTFVRWFERAPDADELVSDAGASPFHVVKVERRPTRYVFTKSSPVVAPAWKRLELQVDAARGSEVETDLLPTGEVRVQRREPLPVTDGTSASYGRATLEEVDAIRVAYARSTLGEGAAGVGVSIGGVAATERNHLLRVVALDGSVRTVSGGGLTNDSRFGPLVQALLALSRRIEAAGKQTVNGAVVPGADVSLRSGGRLLAVVGPSARLFTELLRDASTATVHGRVDPGDETAGTIHAEWIGGQARADTVLRGARGVTLGPVAKGETLRITGATADCVVVKLADGRKGLLARGDVTASLLPSPTSTPGLSRKLTPGS